MTSFHDPDLCRNILESLPTGLCVLDMQKKIVFWRDGAERITGYLRHKVIGHSCVAKTLLHCDQPGCEFCKEDCPMARAIKTAQPAEAIGFCTTKPDMNFLPPARCPNPQPARLDYRGRRNFRRAATRREF